ncbi:MAG: hypothetical protein ACYC7E_02375 [Armatimonadota bacterium]
MFLCVIAVVSAAIAGERKIVLRDFLNQQWTNELLTYQFTAKRGECRVGSVTLVGPKGVVPVQLSQVEYWPKSDWVKSARVTFLADLSPLGNDTYVLRYGVATPNVIRSAPTGINRGNGVVELCNEKFAIRLLLGEKKYLQPVVSSEVPGPIITLRAPDGAWYGGSRLYGTTKITGYSATITESGPVVSVVTIRYNYEGGAVLTLTARLAAGDSQVLWDTHSSADLADDGWQIILNRGLGAMSLPWTGKFVNNKWGKLNEKKEIPLDAEPAGVLVSLQPWADWWDGCTSTVWTFKAAGKGEVLKVSSREPGDWVEPLAPGTLRDWGGWVHKLIQIQREVNGEIALQVSNAAGWRKWQLGNPAPGLGYRLNVVKDYVLQWAGDAGTHPQLFMTKGEMEEARKRNQPLAPELMAGLKNYWIGGLYKTPDGSYIPSYHDTSALGAYLLTGDLQVGKEAKVLERFRNHMIIQGKFDTMRYTCLVVEYYDTLIDDPIVPEGEKAYLRALMAYLGYKLADPATWSCERGYRSYNLNMSVANVLNLGMLASAIPTHPMAKAWVKPALAMTEAMLQEAGPEGEWGESITNYTGVTVSSILAFAIAAKNAGFHDYVNDPRMKRVLLCHTKMYTPRDPRSGGQRVAGFRGLPPHGRAGAGNRESLAGVMAHATLKSDPAYSRALQWAWLESGAPYLYHDSRLGGLEYLYLDKTLPAEKPKWTTDLFPLAGVVMRNGLGTENEHQVNLITGDFSHAIFASETGAFSTIFSYGKPVAGSFAGGYSEREEYMLSRVSIARELESEQARKGNGGYAGFPYNLEESSTGKRVVKDQFVFGGRDGIGTVNDFSTLPRQDYSLSDVGLRYKRGIAWGLVGDLPAWPPVAKAGKAPVDWRRQVLFLKDDDPEGPNYLLLRDTVKGNQPTMWQMWTVSETVDTPENVKDVAAVLANKPGAKILPVRELKGDRFTAIGQFDVDVEYYIANPTNTPRHTLRWGTKYTYSPVNQFTEYKDLLHLQMAGDGAYYVAFFPRKRTAPVPVFATLGNGTIIKASGPFGTDYGFLSAFPGEGSGEGAFFKGTAASVQNRTNGLVLSLGAGGEVRFRSYGIAAEIPVSVRIGNTALTLELPEKVLDDKKLLAPFPGGTVTLTLPGAWTLDKPQSGVTLESANGGLTLRIPAVVTKVNLIKK